MYVPVPYKAPDVRDAYELIRNYPFGIMTLLVDGRMKSVHAPFILVESGEDILLQAHIARVNDISRHLQGQEILVHFSGPHSYVSPAWYSHENHYPTWIYASVHVYGEARLMQGEELPAQLLALIDSHESKVDNGENWQITTMPEELTEKLKSMIIGFEIKVTTLEPCFKLNQHKDIADVQALATALRSQTRNNAAELADLMETHFQQGDREAINNYLRKYDTD
jgi:transcriptional regulator